MKQVRPFSSAALQNGINRSLSDSRKEEIDRKSIRVYGEADWEAIRAALREWENEGLLEILTDPKSASDSDTCIRMKSYIGRTSPISGFLNYEKGSNQA
jgi:hypothetical protein